MTAFLEVTGDEVIGRPGQSLNEVELATLVGLADGIPARLLATQMGVAESTLRYVEQSLHSKLGAKNKAHLITRGFTLGVLIPRALAILLCVVSALESDHDIFRQRFNRRPRNTYEFARLVRLSPSTGGNGRTACIS